MPTATNLFPYTALFGITYIVLTTLKSLNIYSLFTAPELYILSITDLSIFLTVKIKDLNQNNHNSSKIPFIKIILLKDKYNPLPKPYTYSFLGIVLNYISKVVEGILNIIYYLKFPV